MLFKTISVIQRGFTLIELMIVLSIVALLMGLVGPLVIGNIEKAQAKQELLTAKQWFIKISHRAFSSGQTLYVELAGKKVTLFAKDNQKKKQILHREKMEYIFFKSQILTYSAKGFVSPDTIEGVYRDNPMVIDLKILVNGDEVNSIVQ